MWVATIFIPRSSKHVGQRRTNKAIPGVGSECYVPNILAAILLSPNSEVLILFFLQRRDSDGWVIHVIDKHCWGFQYIWRKSAGVEWWIEIFQFPRRDERRPDKCRFRPLQILSASSQHREIQVPKAIKVAQCIFAHRKCTIHPMFDLRQNSVSVPGHHLY